MVKERRKHLPGLAALAMLLLAPSLVMAAGLPVRLVDAGQSGVFNVGSGQASVNKVAGPDGNGEALKLDYTLPRGTAAGLWAKGFLQGLDADRLDVVKITAEGVGPDQARRVDAKLEIKGSAGTQRIPLDLGKGRIDLERPIDWREIGTIQEVVFAIGQVGEEPASGSITLDVSFEQVPILQKFLDSPFAKFACVLLIAAAFWLVEVLVKLSFGEGQVGFQSSGVRRDLVQGVGTALIAALALAIFEFGGQSGSSWGSVWFAVAGLFVAIWWKWGLTLQHNTPGEAFRDALAIGLLGVSSSPMLIFQAPSNWSQVFQLSQAAASVAALAYLASIAVSVSTTARRAGPIVGAWIVGTPYVLGSLVLLSSPGMTRSLGAIAGADWPELQAGLGRVVVLFLFNEALAQGLSLATKRRLMASIPAHLALLMVAIAAVAGPYVADYGSGAEAASLGSWGRLGIAVVTTMLSQAGLWGEVYLVTGLLMDAIHGTAPSRASAASQPFLGMKKGMIYSGTFMAILYGMGALWTIPGVRRVIEGVPVVPLVLFGALAFPLVKTIFETFDGSQGFFRRVLKSYRSPWLYARGAVVGLALGLGLALGISGQSLSTRVWFGFGFGLATYAGINLLADAFEASLGRRRVQSWRVYLVQGLLGGFIGAALGFYFDSAQVAVVVAKFHEYLGVGLEPRSYGVIPFLSRWGHIDLGTQTGGVKLLYDEALSGVIEWSIPAWLFAINRTFMAGFFQKESAPIKALFTKAGIVGLTELMIVVLRWGLWMSPIIKSFLRPMGDPTWYNQDGAIRTLLAIYQDATLSPDAFRAWSLQVFIYLLAFDAIRILIWLDHMGLRVATLVNLSFLGMDRLDSRVARFVSPAATARFIPEGVKRFTTWAPLLIPFYIPKGKDWDQAWSAHEAMQARHGGGTLLAPIEGLPVLEQVALMMLAAVACSVLFSLIRSIRGRKPSTAPASWSIANTEYEVTLKSTGEVSSQCRGYDVTRRSYDTLDPSGRALFVLVDDEPPWAVVGNAPGLSGAIGRVDDGLRLTSERHGLRVTVDIRAAGPGDPAEVWTLSIEYLTDRPRSLKVVPYLEWVLNKAEADRGHTQYNRLFAEMEYARGLHAVLAWDNHAKAMGFLASDLVPEGFLTSRMDFIGRSRSLWNPRALETLAFSDSEHQDTDAHPTFDPIGSLLLNVYVPVIGEPQFRLLIGMAKDKAQAIDLIARHLQIPGAKDHSSERRRKAVHSIRHGEVPPGTPQPYYEYVDDGRTLRVLTPFTPRPYDHAMSNALGHFVSVTNRGFQTTSSVNSQQNRITPDWPDTVTREVPPEAFYLFDPESKEWYSPTYQPSNDTEATYESEFSVDGTAVFHMKKGSVETELTVFVPLDEPCGVYLLTVRNTSPRPTHLRFASYFQIVLAAQPEYAGPLEIRRDEALNALFFTNPRNTYRTGPAFAAISVAPDQVETSRGRFFGPGRNVAAPEMLVGSAIADHSSGLGSKRSAIADPTKDANVEDDRPIAAFLAILQIPAHGETSVVVILGQAGDRDRAEAVIRKYQDVKSALSSLESTRRWWLSLMDTVQVKTASPEFDRYLDWLKYQALAERIWARRGFYQASGAFGFRDQLQDSVNLIWMDPALARAQIILHGSQQFLEGDVVHWFHRLQDGRTGFVARTHASDNLLWLAWGAVEYVGATGDESLLDERTPYLESELPFPPLPANKSGMGFDPLRSSREDTIYRHCLKAIDLVLDKRMGAHGLPLIGTGDWNDGLDEIGSQGRGESVWLGFFLYYILERMAPIVGKKEGDERQDHYLGQLRELGEALESTWRDDRYLRAFHDDGTEIGVKGSGLWEIDALNAAWAVMAGINPGRGRVMFETALTVLEQETSIFLGWPPLREDSKPYLGRSSEYPEGVRENGMYCHGVQWLAGAARLLSNQAAVEGRADDARHYREAAYRLWRKISPLSHVEGDEIETYGGQPNKQAADIVTTFDPGRMIWHGYTGAAGWMFRQGLEGVLGYRLVEGRVVPPLDPDATPADLGEARVSRDLEASPLPHSKSVRIPKKQINRDLIDQL
jgi:cyclic beta-1,2-glucan synthetase